VSGRRTTARFAKYHLFVLHLFFTGLIVLAALATTWFAGYVVYRMYSDAR
jgi:hypothetical protein